MEARNTKMRVPTEGGKKEEFIDGLLNARLFM